MTTPNREGLLRATLTAVAPGALYFLADLHLDPGPSERREAFLDLLSLLSRPPRPAGLYILGDLFDVWTGKGSLADPGHRPVISALRALADSGVLVTVFRGNRDFLLDGRFASRSGSTLVEEGLVMGLGSRNAFLCHGDNMFPEDRLHLMFRGTLRSALVRSLAAGLPARALAVFAHWIRGSSGRRRSGGEGRKRREVPVFPARSAARIFRGGFDLLIAGHVHEERRRRLSLDGRTCELWTLGAWEERGSVLEFARDSLEFKAWPFKKA
jgi:UDP-2,3-diacylglucosamine hydrolase